jgi:DNA-binding XRE family transcriptional regulator
MTALFSLRELREKHTLTQEQMAQIVGVSRPTYIRLENDRTDLSLKQAQKVAEYFHISLDDLV